MHALLEPQRPSTIEDGEFLLNRGSHPHRPTVENRVAYQWELEGDLLGAWNGSKKNHLTLASLARALEPASSPSGGGRAVLDVGCAYGNMLLMLNAWLGKPANVRFVGIDLYPGSIECARAFARRVPGYTNCEYQVADLSAGLPFPDASFDAVNLGDVLEHMVDPGNAIRELVRVTKPGGLILISTPLKSSLFKRTAKLVNRISGGRVYRSYYAGKDTPLDVAGRPVMVTSAGHDHISEMTFPQLRNLLRSQGIIIEKCHMVPIMSGSKWFDRHPFLLSFLLFFEAIHSVLQFRSWAHSVIVAARLPMAKVGR